jgi:hypothetical protein
VAVIELGACICKKQAGNKYDDQSSESVHLKVVNRGPLFTAKFVPLNIKPNTKLAKIFEGPTPYPQGGPQMPDCICMTLRLSVFLRENNDPCNQNRNCLVMLEHITKNSSFG